jgi:DNA-binding transcriptional regulator YiaG
MTQAELADALESDIRTVRRWENGEREIPGPVRVALRLMVGAPASERGIDTGGV